MCLSEGERSMALEAVVYPQTQQDPFGYGAAYYGLNKDFSYNNFNLFQPPPLLGGGSYEDFNDLVKEEEDQGALGLGGEGSVNFLENNYPYNGDWNNNNNNNSSTTTNTSMLLPPPPQLNNEVEETSTDPQSNTIRPKRRRARSRKNKEEIENQRMTHIAVERNRRKQMNDYLSVLRSLMPDSYIQRGDQASIIGGAINFVKELEHKMHFLGAHKKSQERKSDPDGASGSGINNNNNKPFSEFFSFPQYTSTAPGNCENSATNHEQVGEIHSGVADIEVTMVESHANLKIRSNKRPKQLLKMVSGLQNLRLTVLHLNVTTTAQIVLYSLSVKVEDDCKLGSVDDIAAAVYQMLNRIQQEAMLN